MAKKSRQKAKQKQKKAYIRAQQKANRPSARLDEAVQHLHAGDLAAALELSSAALNAAADNNTRERVQSVLAEVYFRRAATQTKPSLRMRDLDAALALTPNDTRLHYHSAATLIRLGRTDKALQALDRAAKTDPKRPDVAYLRSLLGVVSGQPYVSNGFKTVEENMLQLVEGIRNGANAEQLKRLVDALPADDARMLWLPLLAMHNSDSAAPDFPLDLASSPEYAYYSGVAAMRKNNAAAARGAWTLASRGMNRAWLGENFANQLQEEAIELGRNGQWREVLSLAQSLSVEDNKVLSEAVGIALFHVGYRAAQQGDWQEAAAQWRAAREHINTRHLLQNLALAEEMLEEWIPAAEAWREMVKRRPRKADHPDYLTDAQVAALWRHAAECYDEEELYEEVITCLKNAIKYGADDTDLRLMLVDAYMGDDRQDAAENELNRILEIDPDYKPALMRLGLLYTDDWEKDAMPIWRRILALDPDDRQAADALAKAYVENVDGSGPWGLMSRFGSTKNKIKELQKGLTELPDHPILLLTLGRYQYVNKQNAEARATLRKAWEAAPKDVALIGPIMHELLHADGGEIVEEMVPHVRGIPGLLGPFWVDQGKRVLDCELGENWARRFFDEAVAISNGQNNQFTKAFMLVHIVEEAYEAEAFELAESYEEQIRKEAAHTGALEFVQSYNALHFESDQVEAERFLRSAERKAKKAGETQLVGRIHMIQAMFKNRNNPLFSLFGSIGLDPDDMFDPDEPFDPDNVVDFLENLDEKALNELRKIIGI